MSEYQFYHFQTVDQPLSQQQMRELRSISTRADITPTSFINTYNWGDLKADPRDLMRQYFDAFVYTANWGTHQLMFKIPPGDTPGERLVASGDVAPGITTTKLR